MDTVDEKVLLTLDGGVGVITMNDPARRNALGRVMLSGLISAIQDAERAEARAIVLRAAPGCPVWCAGFDIGALGGGVDPLARDGALHTLFAAIAGCPAPVIAMLDGGAWGGGADLALRCDIAIGSPAASLAFTPARLGLPYDPEGLANVLLRAGLAVAMEMFATAQPVAAERALVAGMLNHVVPAAELEAFTLAMAARIAGNAPLAVMAAKRQLRALNAALPVPPAAMQALLEARATALASEDFAEGIAAFRAKRAPVFRGR